MDILRNFASNSLMIQFILLLLLFFSITTWTIILIKFAAMRRAVKESEYFLEIFWESRDLSVAYKEARELDRSPLARIFGIGYLELKKIDPAAAPAAENGASLGQRFDGLGRLRRSLRRAVDTEVSRLSTMVPFLATAGNTTPFIGLFGTVWGIMESLQGIGITGTVSLAVVVPGIADALSTTAAGLGVAIPSVIAFNYFIQKLRVIESELENFSADFQNIVEMDILPAKGKIS
jgi:biopolymer transport protein TolQ